MNKQALPNIEEPLNANERYLYNIAIRLDALCYMVDGIVRHISEKEGVATEDVKEEILDVKSAPEQCEGKTRGGKRCKNSAEEGSQYCTLHKKKG